MGDALATIWSLSDVKDFATEAVIDILAQRGVPRGELRPPDMDIVVPGIEALRYSPLRREIAALIATTMDAGASSQVLPAYLGLLKDLSRDEFNLLAALPPRERIVPVAHLTAEDPRGRSYTILRNLLSERLSRLCVHRDNIPQYVDNLRRLGLVHAPSGISPPAHQVYRDILRENEAHDGARLRRQGLRLRTGRDMIALTDFGEGFRAACQC